MFMFVVLHTMKYWILHFQVNIHITLKLFWKQELKVVMMRVNVMKNIFLYDIFVSAVYLMYDG